MRVPYYNIKTKQQDDFFIDDLVATKILDRLVSDWKRNRSSPSILYGGNVGTGKTTLMVEHMVYIKNVTGINFDLSDIYFSPEDYVRDTISTTKKQRAMDEAVVGLMASEWNTTLQKQLMKMFMMCRKKMHFNYLCMPSPEKLRDYIFVNATNCLFYTYKRRDSELGYFLFFDKKAKERLYREWKKTGMMRYEKHYTFRGTFPSRLYNIIPEEEYELKKDIGISKVLGAESERQSKFEKELQNLKILVSQFPEKFKLPKYKVYEALQITDKTFTKWEKLAESSKKSDFSADFGRQKVKNYLGIVDSDSESPRSTIEPSKIALPIA